mgnify:CR=1 FL=1
MHSADGGLVAPPSLLVEAGVGGLPRDGPGLRIQWTADERDFQRVCACPMAVAVLDAPDAHGGHRRVLPPRNGHESTGLLFNSPG